MICIICGAYLMPIGWAWVCPFWDVDPPRHTQDPADIPTFFCEGVLS